MARAWQQLGLDEARHPTGRGGWRPGAGRPRGPTTASHAVRASFTGGIPQHVTLRIVRGERSLRRERAVCVVCGAIATAHRDDFRIVEFVVMSNHLHLLVEAADERALARGMQGLAIRIAKRLNVVLGRRGRLFAERYHARALRSPREVRLALRYVLLNSRRHAAERGERLALGWIDPWSSGPWFDGWRQGVRGEAPGLRELTRTACPTARGRTWLLTIGWRRGGLIAIDEVPGKRVSRVRAEWQ